MANERSVRQVNFNQSYLPYIQSYQQVIFDFDDTVALTETAKRNEIIQFFASLGHDPDTLAEQLKQYTRAELAALYNQGAASDVEHMLANLNRSLESVYAKICIPSHHLPLFDLHNACILSAGRAAEILACMQANKVGGTLPVHISSGKDKTASLQQLINHREVLFVGDSDQDEKSARNLGIDFLRVTT